MRARAWFLFKALLILFAIGSPFVTHVVLASADWGGLAYVLIGGQTLLALWVVRVTLNRPWSGIAGIVILAVAAMVCLHHSRGGILLSAGLPHGLVYLGLLAFFGLSLRPGRIPVVTGLSHQIHGALPPAIDRYTRQVTGVWCLFCAGQLLGSALLLWLAPLTWWSIFVNILNAPLLAMLFLGEKMTRAFWVTNPPHERLRDIFRMVALVKVQMAQRDRGCPRPRET